MAETFVEVRGFPSYQISNLGRVISNKRETARFLKPSINNNGYLIVALCNEGVRKSFGIHRLIAMHFLDVPDDEENLVVDHINCRKDDNRVENLRWATYSENSINRDVYGTISHLRTGRWEIGYTLENGDKIRKSLNLTSILNQKKNCGCCTSFTTEQSNHIYFIYNQSFFLAKNS